MATTFIPINTGQRLGQQLRGAVDQLTQIKAQIVKLQNVMATMDQDALEQQFGLQAGAGEFVSAMITAISTDLSGKGTTELISRCG